MKKMIVALGVIGFALAVVSTPSYGAPTPENTPDYFVEWVQPNGALYVDTGITGKCGTKAEIGFSNANSGTYPCLLGSFRKDATEKRFHLLGFWRESVRFQYGTKFKEDSYAYVPYGGNFLVESEIAPDGTISGRCTRWNGVVETGSVSWGGTEGIIDTGVSMYLFADHCKESSGDRATDNHLGRLYHCRIWQTKGEDAANYVLVRDYRPCVKDGVAGVYDAVSETIFHPVGNRLDAGPVKLGGGHAVGPVAHPATQWGRISYDADRKGMNDNSWMSISLPGYVAQGAGDIANLNGSNSSWQGENLKHSQLRFDGWFQVSADKAGVWNISQKFDDYFALYIDNRNVLYNNSYNGEAKSTVKVTEGWHRFTIIAGDTFGNYGSNKDYGGNVGPVPFAVSVNGGAAMAFNAANFPQGKGTNNVRLDADADWSDRGALILNGGTVLDLNGHRLTVKDIACDDYIGSKIVNTASKKATLLFKGNPFKAKVVADGLIQGLGTKITVAKAGEDSSDRPGAATSTPEGFTDNLGAALKRAKRNRRHVVVVFSGSDWCHWCKALEKEVLSTEAFRKVATNTYELVYIDNPKNESLLSKHGRMNNERLTEEYKVKGFPTVLVLDGDGKKITKLGYEEGGPVKYLETLATTIREAPDVEKYIKPIEAVLNRHDENMQKEMEGAIDEVKAKFPKPDGKLSKKEKRKLEKEMSDFLYKIMFERIAGKYIPLYTKAFAEARAMKVPAHMEKKKTELIDGQEMSFNQLKAMREAYLADKAKKASGAKADDDKDGREDKDDDADDDDGDKMVEAARMHPKFRLPRPDNAKLETDYWTNVAMPFYVRHFVDTFVPPAGMSEKDAKRVRGVRRALARYLATGRDEFPTGAECAEADVLWRAKCRDAAVAIVHYIGLEGDSKYWQGNRVFREAVANHDFGREPVLGFVLRAFAVKSAAYHIQRKNDEPRKPLEDARAECEKAFASVLGIYKAADRRILERFAEIQRLPLGVLKAFGDEYLTLCQTAKDCMERASDARGSGWASSVTEEGWKGWGDYNAMAASNLLAAVRLRPEEPRAAMMLSSLAGRSCAVGGDSLSWAMTSVSNSLDCSAETIERCLHFQTSRWGGSTEFLRDFVMECATNVDVRSTFSYRGAATALDKLFTAEADGMTQKGVVEKIITPDMAKALYAMFDAYAAAPETEFMPSADVFRGMGMSLAMQRGDWASVRRYWKSIRSPLRQYRSAQWLRRVDSPALDGIYLRHVFEVLSNSARAEDFLKAEEAAAAGRHDEAFKMYAELEQIRNPSSAEKYLASGRFFAERRFAQEKVGGWIDIMPSRAGGEANHWWGITGTDPDGRARIRSDRKGYYRVQSPIPGIGVEIEATVHFEKRDAKQRVWNVGWGLARVFSGFCAENSSWAFPYIGFCRDEKGDHYFVQAYTRENEEDAKKDADKASLEIGSFPMLNVSTGNLQVKDSHAFSLKTTDGKLSISVDGNEVYSAPLDESTDMSRMRDRIQPNGDVLPVWKLFKNTSFSNYRYRRVPKER